MADALFPVSICREYCGGTLLTYEVNNHQAMTLVHPSLLPKPSPGCKSKWRENDNIVKGFRLPDGRVRLTISERLVRQRDARFQKFMTVAIAVASSKEAAHV